jgi:glucokinase
MQVPHVPAHPATLPNVRRMDPILAIDIGGTKLAAGIVVGDELVRSRRTPTEGADSEALFATLTALAAGVVDEHVAEGGRAPTAVGVGCGGPMEPDGVAVSPLNIPQWRAFALRDRLAERFGLPVRVDNDAKALALAEGWLGAARGCDDYVAMVVSTGVGGGFVVDGRLLDGASSNAGHIGHVVVVPDGRPCRCGSRGCLEAETSGTSIAAITGRPAAEATPEVVARTGQLVGRAVGWFVVALDLRLACVAGSVALGFGEPFFAAANAELEAVARIGYARGARIVPAGLGAEGPLLGAAAVARRGAA